MLPVVALNSSGHDAQFMSDRQALIDEGKRIVTSSDNAKSLRKVTIVSLLLDGAQASELSEACGETSRTLRKYRIIKAASRRVHFAPRSKSFRATGDLADFADLLAVNQESCEWWMSEKAPPDVPPYCAVVP